MLRTLNPWDKNTKTNVSFDDLFKPITTILPEAPALEARGDRQLQMAFEHQFKEMID